MSDVTQILSKIDAGDPQAAGQLLPLVYDELRKLAAARLAQEKPGQTLQATALVHEAYLRLVGTGDKQDKETGRQGDKERENAGLLHSSSPCLPLFSSRGHFFAAAAEAMRRILVDSARRKQSKKRGGDGAAAQRVCLDLDQVAAATSERLDEVLDIDFALGELAQADPQAAELVKLRYFAGLSIPQAAAVLGVSPRSADFLWAYARACLLRSLGGGDAPA